MERTLVRHSDTPSSSIQCVTVGVERIAGGQVSLTYTIEAPLGSVRLPDPKQAGRAGGLWQRTCFEAFVRLPQESGYAEFNLSPSSQWAAYRFDAYRAGMADLWVEAVPRLTLSVGATRVVLDAELTLPEPWADALLLLGLSAVIEEADGTKSYWALAHPPGAPDFHHPDCFAMTLEPPERP